MTLRRVFVGAATIALMAPFAPGASADTQVTQQLTVPVHVSAHADAWCDNTGSTVEISGGVTMGGVTTRIWFQNNVRGTHQSAFSDVPTEVVLTPDNDPIVIPKQPYKYLNSVGPNGQTGPGVGGNPWISFDFLIDGVSVTNDNPILLGRCVQLSKTAPGLSVNFSGDFNLPVIASSLIHALTCDGQQAQVTVDSSVTDSGIDGLLLFDNNINKVVHRATATGEISLHLTHAVTTAKGGWGHGGVGGNPLVYAQFRANGGVWAPTPGLVGRCKKI